MKKSSNQENRRSHAVKAPDLLRALWQEGYFADWRDQDAVTLRLGKGGTHLKPNTLRMALSRAPHLTSRSVGKATEYIQQRPAISEAVDRIESDLFEDGLAAELGAQFETELADLRLNFAKSGNCTAFLLRKVLEKLTYLTFAKHGIAAKLEVAGSPGYLIGLDAMIEAAAREKIGGMPLLTPRTAREVRGIKFLGDMSAHNPLTNVDMKTIVPQMPFIITAYKELLRYAK